MTYAKILVVEDESIVAKDIQYTLKDLGYNVAAISFSGEDAIKQAEKLHPDLILMDIKLKGVIDGIEAAKQIHDKSDVPIVYLTAFADQATLNRAKITEPFGYILKPFEEKELHSVIEMALYKHKLERMLRDSERLHKDLYNNSPDGYLSVNPNGDILEANETFLKMMGHNIDDTRGENIAEFVEEKDVKIFKENYGQLIINGSLSNFECNFKKKNGEILTALLNASVDYDEARSPLKARLVIRDICSLKKLEKDKKELSEKVIKLTKKIPLTDNEKKVFYGIVKYPLLNDIELSHKLKIKRSTITSIKNKLKKDQLYSPYRIPNLSIIGCELLIVMHAKLNSSAQHRIKKFAISREAANAAEQIYMATTDRELMGICASRNLTDFKKHFDNLSAQYEKYELIEEGISAIYFPLETSRIEKLFDFSSFLGNMFELSIEKESTPSIVPKKRKLTEKEKVILYSLVKFPELNDSEMAEMAKLPRPSVSQTRRRLIKEGFLEIVNIPNPIQLRCELLVLNYLKYNPKSSANNTGMAVEHAKNMQSAAFAVSGNSELYSINIYDDYTQYEIERNKETVFYNENKVTLEKHIASIFPIPQIQFQKLDFAPLVKKVLELKTDF